MFALLITHTFVLVYFFFLSIQTATRHNKKARADIQELAVHHIQMVALSQYHPHIIVHIFLVFILC